MLAGDDRSVWAFVLGDLGKKETDNKQMARGKRTGGFKLGTPGPGRPKGSKDKIPRASMKAALNVLANSKMGMLMQNFERGFKARPPHSAPYFRLAFEYLDGKPPQTLEVKERQVFKIIAPDPEESEAGE